VSDLLLNHIVNGTYYSGGLLTGDTITTLGGHELIISKNMTCKPILSSWNVAFIVIIAIAIAVIIKLISFI
jgi:hypothetical protein